MIDGGCPCMFAQTADAGHKVMKFFLSLSGNVPRQIPSRWRVVMSRLDRKAGGGFVGLVLLVVVIVLAIKACRSSGCCEKIRMESGSGTEAA